jgi:GDP-L-fucose synthase
MDKASKIYVAGHRGMVGSAITRRLIAEGYTNVIGRTHAELDLTDTARVNAFFDSERPHYVFLAAAKVGGIQANNLDNADFILENLQIQTNVINAAWKTGAEGLQFLGSACIFPRLAPQPMPESALLTGPLEPTNEMYAIAKIAGLKLCEALNQQYGFNANAIMPTNLYGPGDNFNLRNSHVLPAFLRKFDEAKRSGTAEVEIWGTGAALREFLHVDDLAGAAVFLMRNYRSGTFINVGSGDEVSIAELAELVRRVVGFEGALKFDSSKPDGMPRKLLDTSRIRALGWKPDIPLEAGVRATYSWYLKNLDSIRT